MRSKWTKLILVCALMTLMMTIGAISAFADNYDAGHFHPTGGTSTYYAYTSSECNRTINVTFKDTGGSTVRKVVIHTKHGVDATLGMYLCGYDIVGFSSNQSVLETCKMGPTSGCGTCTGSYLYIYYYFRTALSKSELNVTVTVRKWDPVSFEVRHYVEQDPTLNNFHRDNYQLHSTTNQQSLNYYASFSVSKKTITGYTLRSDYNSTVSGNLCFHQLAGATKNTPSSPRCYSYDLIQGTASIGSSGVSSYSESSDGTLRSCSNRKYWVEFFYDRNEYTISYNANGGSGAPSSQKKYYGVSTTLSTTKPTRNGYTFKGWGTASTSTSPSYQPGGTYTGNASRTLYAVWESNAPKTYTVSYNANGGSGAPATQTKTHGVTLTLSSTKPTRTGYTFKGWSTSSTATAASYSAGGSYTGNASITLYAVWAKTTYTVQYNANGGSGAPSAQTKTYGVTLTLSTVKPTRSGYTFAGWNVVQNATVAMYMAGGNYTSNSSTTLYAIWQRNYTVSYNANGGSGAPASQTKIQDNALTLSSVKPTRSGYTFVGWATNSTATNATYAAGGTYTANASVTLYAVWQQNPPMLYTIYFDDNGGTGGPVSQLKTHGVALTLSTTKPTRQNYTFLGWSVLSTATSAMYTAGGTYTANSTAMLYAVWEYTPPATYTITYDANGGSGAPASQTKTEGIALTLSATIPTRTHHTFLGWATDSSATSADYSSGGSYTANASATLYAVWAYTPPATYTVSYHANGGTGAPSAQTKTEGETLTLSTVRPTRTGYTFYGWATDSTASAVVYAAGDSYTADASVTLYAVWQVNQYSVTYNANGGYGAPSAQTKTYGVALTLSSTIPTRSGYNFLGWGIAGNDTEPSYAAGGTYTANSGINLYAVWQRIPETYTIAYNANGGSGAPASQTKIEGVTLTLTTDQPTRSGYTFLGWSTSNSASSPTYYAGGSYTANAAATLYAVWEYIPPETYTISFDGNGGSDAPASVIKTEGVTLYLPTTVPTRFNYAFRGWSTSRTATTATYSPGGSFTKNAATTLYAVWEYDPVKYSVSYSANGGSGAPATQTKTYGVDLTLSAIQPTRSGYDFMGWATSSSSTSISYAPGDNYADNANVTLYAVWQLTNYDFSISDLTFSKDDPYKYDQITVKVRVDNWDTRHAYEDIPVQLYYDGRLVFTQDVDLAVYGVANITFTLNVGGSLGDIAIEARVNWADHRNETRTGNNSVSSSILVRDFDCEVTVDPITVTGNYCEGMDIITSFYVLNNSDYDITPDMHNTARFVAYYYNESNKAVITTQDWADVVVPAGGTNLVYFKWKVPAGLNGKTVYLECTVNADQHMNEENYENNTLFTTATVSLIDQSQTPDTRFESEAPSSYQNVSTPSDSTDQATWTMWEYEDGSFVLKKYGIQISSDSPVVAPSSDCVSAVYENDKWTMRSGYGITMSYAPSISTVSGYDHPDSNAYTSVQYAVATFPEFRYFDTNGNCRTLQYANDSYQFVENTDADGNARVHFIPVYVRDGNYTVSVTATHVWTPAGMIEATRSANVIIIDGTIYDDWYQG